jgi:hypothetical protein
LIWHELSLRGTNASRPTVSIKVCDNKDVSNTPSRGRQSRIQQLSVPNGEAIAEFTEYAAAVDHVDQLIRHEFPAAMVAIVGSDLKSVERVRGRLSYGRVAIQGLISGSWIGLLIALFLPAPSSAASATASFTVSTGAAIVIGAGIGMLLNILRFSFSRNRHEFSSTSAVVAAKYEVVVPHPLVEQAKKAIAEHQANCL